MTPIVRMNKKWHPDLVEKARLLSISEDETHIRMRAEHWLAIAPSKSRGLGDTIAKATKAVGIKPCGGCKKRQAKLNKLVPYKKSP